MRVKIAYTVEDNEIPQEIAKFLEEAQKKAYENGRELGELSSKFKQAFDLNNLEEYLAHLHVARVSLVKIDTIIDDCTEIVDGLKQLIETHVEKENKESLHPVVEERDDQLEAELGKEIKQSDDE